MGGACHGPILPLEDNGWGWIAFGLTEIQEAADRVRVGTGKLDKALDDTKSAV